MLLGTQKGRWQMNSYVTLHWIFVFRSLKSVSVNLEIACFNLRSFCDHRVCFAPACLQFYKGTANQYSEWNRLILGIERNCLSWKPMQYMVPQFYFSPSSYCLNRNTPQRLTMCSIVFDLFVVSVMWFLLRRQCFVYCRLVRTN